MTELYAHILVLILLYVASEVGNRLFIVGRDTSVFALRACSHEGGCTYVEGLP